MSDTVKLIIEIPKEMHEKIKDGYVPLGISKYLKNGTPLPKGHGRLIDADNLKNTFIKWSKAVQGSFIDSTIASIVCNSPTIIEPDKAESEGK